MKKLLLFLFAFFFATTFCSAQSSELESLQASLKNPKNNTHYVDALNRMVMLLFEKNVDSAFYFTVKARKIADSLHYEKGQADALNNLGVFFDVKGNQQFALRYYSEAYVAYTKLNDTANRVQTIMNVAMVYKQLGKDKEAIRRYKEAFDLGKKLGKDSIMSLAMYNYVLQFPNELKKDEVGQYISRAKQIAHKYKDQRTLLALEQLEADQLIDGGNGEVGMAMLRGVVDRAVAQKLYFVSMDMHIDLGDRLADTDPESAASYYQSALDLANKNGYLIYSKFLTKKLFDFYVAHNNSSKANEYSKQFIKVIEEQEELDNQSGVDYIDYVLKGQQVDSLLIKSKYQTVLLVLLLVGCVLAVVVIISIRQHLRRTKRMNELVSKQNADMKRTLDALEQSQSANTRMMKIAAHDLRNPIGGIYSLMSIMLADPDRSADDKEILETIKTSAHNSLELVSDLLEVQFDTENFKKEPLDVSEILEYCVSLLQNKAEAKNQQIRVKSKRFVLPANREKLWRVISNLISNAIKFSPVGTVIDVVMEDDTNGVLIKVRDHGIGIPPEMGDKIFDMFTQAKRPGTEGEETFGLGLAISKQIVEGHGGKIWFESDLAKGTSFYVALPVK